MTRAAALALVAVASAASAQDAADLGPRSEPSFANRGVFVYYGSMCDCDERDLVLRTRVPLAAHAEPDAASPVVRTVAAGRRIEGNDWDAAVTVVTRAAEGTLQRPFLVEGARRMADPRRDSWDERPVEPAFTLPAGTRVAVYDHYAGEGFFHADGATYYGQVPQGDSVAWDGGRESLSTSEMWWRLVPRDGKPAGWVLIDWNDTARFEMLCETHSGCVDGFAPTFQPHRR